MNGTRIVIPKSLQNEYLRFLHTGHLGISKCRAGLNQLYIGQELTKTLPILLAIVIHAEEVQHALPTFDEHSVEACYPSHIFGSDISNIDGKPHVIIVDYNSFFMYERPMPYMSSETLILALKTIFSESGVPNILITDSGRQYCSEEFKQFSLEWFFIHKTSSPYYPK